MDETDTRTLRRVANYQFGSGAGIGLFSDPEELTVTHTNSGRPRQVKASAGRIATYGTDGRLRLGLEGGRRLQSTLASPAYRVVVGDESEPYVRSGRNAMAKFVRSCDPAIRPLDAVIVEHERGELLAVGRAELSGTGMQEFETGVAVSVREGTA
ncbi:MAG: PUA domain-containing protein [Salinirussus sp.]